MGGCADRPRSRMRGAVLIPRLLFQGSFRNAGRVLYRFKIKMPPGTGTVPGPGKQAAIYSLICRDCVEHSVVDETQPLTAWEPLDCSDFSLVNPFLASYMADLAPIGTIDPANP